MATTPKHKDTGRERKAASPKTLTSATRDTAAAEGLKRITRRVLEELKNPAAIPSVVIQRALEDAYRAGTSNVTASR
jgi:hypothetical protein